VADLDQVLGANLVNLRITEAEKARLAREAAKELKVERGEEVCSRLFDACSQSTTFMRNFDRGSYT